MGSTESNKKRSFKIVLLGGGGVGKSSLTFRLVLSEFLSKYDPTIEDSYRKDNFYVDDEICPLEILDTAGQDQFSGMRDLYYKSGDGFLLVYSIADGSSLDDVRERFQGLLNARACDANDAPPVTVVGNKCDLDSRSRIVSKEAGQMLASELGKNVGWIETSAKADINVTEVFADIVRKIKASWLQMEESAKKNKRKRKCAIL